MIQTELRIALFLTFVTIGIVTAAPPNPPRTDYCGDPLPPGASMRLGTIRMRHIVPEIAFAADGKACTPSLNGIKPFDIGTSQPAESCGTFRSKGRRS